VNVFKKLLKNVAFYFAFTSSFGYHSQQLVHFSAI